MPTGVVAQRGNAEATVSWKAPSDDGGSGVTSYKVIPSPAGNPVTVGAPALSGTVKGLTNGKAYTFTVVAINSAGEGAPSVPSNSVTPAAVPGAPTGVTAQAGDAEANVSWTAPANQGGSPITSYTVTPSPGGSPITVAASQTTATVTGLTNGTRYTFTVFATNDVGNGLPSAPSGEVMPVSVPDSPTAVTGTSGDQQVTVSWAAPKDDGGESVSSYTVTPSPTGTPVTVLAPATTATVLGLTNGTAYTFTVVATNREGNSAPSAPSTAVTPARAPDPPTGVIATRGNASATVTWKAPASDGGSDVTSYTVIPAPSGSPVTVGTTQAVVKGLTNGTAYTFTVIATNAAGDSTPSSPSASVTPATNPDPPTGVTAIGGNKTATISWLPPTNDGGAKVASYTVTPSPSGSPMTVKVPTTSATISGLGNGTTYTFKVVATNAVGDSVSSSASAGVTPEDGTLSASPPKAFASGDNPITLTFKLLDGAGKPISGQSVTLSSSQTSDKFSTSYGTTDLAGMFSTTVTGTSVGARTFTAHIGSDEFNVSGMFISACSGTKFAAARKWWASINPIALVTGDFNRDGNLDIATANNDASSASVLGGKGDGTFPIEKNFGTGAFPRGIATGDFDRDGNLDLAVVNQQGNNVSILLGGGNFTFGAAANYGVSTNPEAVAVGDFNRDGNVDLVIADSTLSLLLGTGAGAFKSGGSLGTSASSVVVADVNGDGLDDIVSGPANIWLGDGHGGFKLLKSYGAGVSPQGIAVGDLNGDGKPDIVVTNSGSNDVSVLLGQGGGIFKPMSQEYPAGNGPEAVAIGDINGDGKPDLAVADVDASSMAVLVGNGNGSFQSPSTYATDQAPYAVVIGDFNNDGKPDIATANAEDSTVSGFINSCQ